MGTSSLYKGPKITSLLPSDYNPDVNPELDAPDETIPTKDEAGEAESQQDDTENEESNEQKEDQSNQPSVKWGTVRSSMRKAMNNRSSGNAKSAIRNYTNQLESFNEELLQRLVGGLIKHYIFDKLLLQSEQTALKSCEHVSDLRELEKSIKKYIDGIVDSVVPNIIKSGLNPEDFNRALETLCDISYQQMEELR